MDMLNTSTAAANGNTNTATQCQQVLKWLQQKPLTTIQARQELYIMSIAARIFDLKEQGHNIVKYWVKAGKKRIAQYVLLNGGNENAG